MNEKTYASTENTQSLVTGEIMTRSRTDSENWRLIMAIDILLDYIMKLEKENLGGDRKTEDKGSS